MASEKRLIDANAFEEYHCNGCPYRREGSCTKDDPICATIQDLKDFPTVDAVEVVHWRWDKNWSGDNIVYCNQCYMPQYMPTPYCASCGAKMDGDGNA